MRRTNWYASARSFDSLDLGQKSRFRLGQHSLSCPGYNMIVPLAHVLILSVILFALGLASVLVWRSNLIMMLIGIEIMLNGAMLAFVGGAGRWGMPDGQIFALMIMAMTSAEVSLALALVVYLHRRKKTVDADEFSEMKG